MRESSADFEARRRAMVRDQLVARGIVDPRVLAALGSVPRERFVPSHRREDAYRDGPVSIGRGQTISQPYIVALMSERLRVGPGDRVLEIGMGCGYQTAVLVAMGCEVHAVERIRSLCEEAEERLRLLGRAPAACRWGDGWLGWPEEAPFDAIVIACAPREIPASLARQLVEGGRLVCPWGSEGRQRLSVFVREGDELREEPVCEVRFVPMLGETED